MGFTVSHLSLVGAPTTAMLDAHRSSHSLPHTPAGPEQYIHKRPNKSEVSLSCAHSCKYFHLQPYTMYTINSNVTLTVM